MITVSCAEVRVGTISFFKGSSVSFFKGSSVSFSRCLGPEGETAATEAEAGNIFEDGDVILWSCLLVVLVSDLARWQVDVSFPDSSNL